MITQNKKYFELQKMAKLSNTQAAELLEVNISTIKRWRNGSVEAPKAVIMAIQYYIQNKKES